MLPCTWLDEVTRFLKLRPRFCGRSSLIIVPKALCRSTVARAASCCGRYCTSRDHDITLNGWGTDNGVDYWLGRNSWGTYWGEHGWFRIARDAYKPEACCKCIRSLCISVQPQRSGCTDWAVPVYNGTGYGQ